MSCRAVSRGECVEAANPRFRGRCVRCGQAITEPDLSGARDPEVEIQFLRSAERRAGLDVGWADRVEARLVRMERSKGRDSYKLLGFWRCVAEADEEGLDLGGWPLMAYLLSFVEFRYDDEAGNEARAILQEVAAHGVRVAGLIERLKALR